MNKNEDLRIDMEKWQRLTDVFHYLALFGSLAAVIILDHIPKDTAKVAVWYFISVLGVVGLISFIFSVKAHKKRMAYWAAENERIMSIGRDLTR